MLHCLSIPRLYNRLLFPALSSGVLMLRYLFGLVLFAVVLLASCLNALARDPVQVPLPATPDGTLKAIGAAVGEGKLEVIWQAMPASHQADVKKALAEFSKKFDADLWVEAHKIVGKISKLLTEKTDFIVATPQLAQLLPAIGVKPEDFKKYLTGFGEMLAQALSRAATLPEVGTLDLEKLLADIGPRAKELHELNARLGLQNSRENLADLYKVDVKLVKSDADTATVELIRDDGSMDTVELVRVEGKWIYKSTAEGWKTKLEEILKTIEGMQFTPEMKQRALVFTGMTNGFLDTFLNAKTQAEFDAAVNGVLPLLGGMLPGGAAPPQPQPLQPLK